MMGTGTPAESASTQTSLARPSGGDLELPCPPAATGRKDDIIQILWVRLPTPFHFLRRGGYRHPVNRFAPSRRTRWPTYKVDSRWTITRPLMEAQERLRDDIHNLIAAELAFASNYESCVCGGACNISANVSEIRRICHLLALPLPVLNLLLNCNVWC